MVDRWGDTRADTRETRRAAWLDVSLVASSAARKAATMASLTADSKVGLTDAPKAVGWAATTVDAKETS